MPIYKFKCPNCEELYTISASFAEYNDVKARRCTNPECDERLVRLYEKGDGKVFIDARFGVTKKGFI